MVYVILFRKLSILIEVIMGAYSFLFYGPTYLIILNIYSICRIDDISWGTKGLDEGSNKNAGLKESWNILKYVHVAKYVIWNIIVSCILLILGSDYIPRFFVTIIMVIIMGMSLSVKIIIAVIYMISYRLNNCKCCDDDETLRITEESRIKKIIDDYRPQIQD